MEGSNFQIHYLQADKRNHHNPSNVWDVDLVLDSLHPDQLDNVFTLHFAPRAPRYFLKVRNLKIVVPKHLDAKEVFRLERTIMLLLNQQKFYVKELDFTWPKGVIKSIPLCSEVTCLCLHGFDVCDADFAAIVNHYPQLEKLEIDTLQLPTEVMFTGISNGKDADKMIKTGRARPDELKTSVSLLDLRNLKTLVLGPGTPSVNKRVVAYGLARMQSLQKLQFYLGAGTDIKLRHVTQYLYKIDNVTIPDLQNDLQKTVDHVFEIMRDPNRMERSKSK